MKHIEYQIERLGPNLNKTWQFLPKIGYQDILSDWKETKRSAGAAPPRSSQNHLVEDTQLSFFARLREELLNGGVFYCLQRHKF